MNYNFDEYFDRSDTDAEKLTMRKKLYGTDDLTPLWVADMDFPTASVITEALKRRLEHPLLGYTDVGESLTDSILWWMSEVHSLDCEKADLLFSPSVVTSIASAVDAFCDGDGDDDDDGDDGDDDKRVVLFSPVYGQFHMIPKKQGRKVGDIPLILENGSYYINWKEFENVLESESVGLLLFCNPHNPGGRVWRVDELKRLVELCRKHKVIIFSDEIHSDLVYAPAVHTPLLSIEGAREVTVSAHSIGKTFNCSGLNGSFLIIPDGKLRRSFFRSQQKFHTEEINLMAKTAICAAFTSEGLEYRRQLLNYLQENIREVCERINESPALISAMVPESTFLVWIDFRSTGLSHEKILEHLIHDAKVGLSGGRFFGESGTGWFRINAAHPRKQLLEAVERICRVFE